MRRTFRVLLFSVFCFIVWNGGYIYPSEDSVQSGKAPSINIFTGPPEVQRYWLQRKDLINSGKTIVGRKGLEQIHQIQLDRGIRNLPIFATLLIREALEVSARGGHQEALALCSWAKMLAPGSPYGYFGLARVHWNRSKLRLDRVLVEYLKGFVVSMKNFELSFIRFTDLLFLIGQSILLAFLLYAFILFLKYFPSFVEGLARNFKAQVFQIIQALIKVVVILLPFFLQLSLIWAFMYWSLVVWFFLQKRERIVLFVFLILLIYIPWTMDVFSTFLDHSAKSFLNTYKANEEIWSQDIKEDLIQRLKRNPGDTKILCTLGLINKREGNYPKAEYYLKQAISNDSSAAEAMTNLANVWLAMGNVDRAIEWNQKAIDLKPRKASFYFNLHRANSKKSTSVVKADPSIQKATELNPQLIHYYLKIETGNMNRYVIDETLSPLSLWKGVIYQFMDKWIDPEGLVSVWVRPLSERWEFVSPVLFLGMVVVLSILARRKGGMRKCSLCGSPSRRVFPRKIGGDFICLGCHRLFVKKEGLNPKIKGKKIAQVRGYRRREEVISRILSLFSLGGGHVWRNYTVRGSILLFIFSMFILRIYHWHGFIRNSEVVAVSSPLSSMAFLIGLFACFYLPSLMSISRFERQKRALEKIRIPL